MKTAFTIATSTTALLLCGGASAFSVDISRREAIQAAVASVATVVTTGFVALPANAIPSEETPRTITRMGGLLVGDIVNTHLVVQCRPLALFCST